MSLECSECEADLRGGHLSGCSRVMPQSKRRRNLGHLDRLSEASRRVVTYTEASASDEWGTDPETFAALNERYEFGFDLAASPPNAKCLRYWTQADDALSKNWAALSAMPSQARRWLWCNPPYSRGNLIQWVPKARAEAVRGARVGMLVPAYPGERWFEGVWAATWCIDGAPETDPRIRGYWVRLQSPDVDIKVLFLAGRQRFRYGPELDVRTTAKSGSCFITFAPRAG